MPSVDLPFPVAQGLLPTVRKYLYIFRVSLIERLTYRADFMVGVVMRFLPLVTTILLWQAVFAGSQRESLGRDGGHDYTFGQMISYLLLVHISRMFSSMPGLANGIARDIREGTIKKYMLQPMDMIGYLLSYRAAHKLAYMTSAALPYAGLFWICSGYFPDFPDAWTMVGYLCALLMGFLLGFFFEASVGMVGFWLLEVTSFLYVINTLNFFVSGHMFPIDLLPPFWASLFKWLPFQYLAYFPAAVFLGKIRGEALVEGLLLEAMWVVLFIVMAKFFYARGQRQYSAYGG